MKNIVLLLCFIGSTISCNSQWINGSFVYKKVDTKLVRTINVTKIMAKQKWVNITSYLPKGYVKSGSVDYTDYIQKGINENKFVKLPNFSILVSEKGLSLKSNSAIYFDEKSKIIIAGNSLPNYQVLDVRNVQNVVIYNPRLMGDRTNHTGTTGEWGMGLNILSSKNITVYNPEITNCWGDGIYISALSGESENINIKGGVVDNNRRNGISIISGKKIQISNVFISNTNGTLPMAGIDVEPNGNNNVLDNISLKNINTFNNGNVGIEIFLVNMIGKEYREVGILIDSHKDYFSRYSFMMGGSKAGFDYSKNFKPLGGVINVTNSQWNDNPYKVSVGTEFRYMPKYKFTNIEIKSNGKKDDHDAIVKKLIRDRGFSIE